MKITIGDFKANMYNYNDSKYKETTITNIFFDKYGIEYILQGQNKSKYISYDDYYKIVGK